MKKLILILIVILSFSCRPGPPTHTVVEVKEEIEPKFNDGELVCVGGEKFIVYGDFNSLNNQYRLKLINCHSDNCIYWVLESEIKKCE